MSCCVPNEYRTYSAHLYIAAVSEPSVVVSVSKGPGGVGCGVNRELGQGGDARWPREAAAPAGPAAGRVYTPRNAAPPSSTRRAAPAYQSATCGRSFVRCNLHHPSFTIQRCEFLTLRTTEDRGILKLIKTDSLA